MKTATMMTLAFALLAGVASTNGADVDKDDRYELYTNFERGSGIISLDILGYNIALKEKYSLSMRFKKDLELCIENSGSTEKK